MRERRVHFATDSCFAFPRAALDRRKNARPGTIFVVTIWIILVLAGLVLVLARAMRVEALASANQCSSLQAEAVEQGAIQYVLARVDGLLGQMPADADTPCEAVEIGQGAFWIIRPNFDDDRSDAFGIVDEGSKVNVNVATQAMLAKLPGMTEELCACIIDWRDTDSTITPAGAEGEYYATLPQAYQCKNAPLETVEELFLVKGATRQILFGEDANRNCVLDANEDDGDASEPPDSRDGRLDRGIFPFVTVYSAEPNRTSDGATRTNVATSSGQAIVGMLQSGGLSETRATEVGAALRRASATPVQNVLDFYVRAGLTPEEFKGVADLVTVSASAGLTGLVNVSTAPKEVLACLPGLDDTDVASLISKRAETGLDLTNIAWVAQALKSEKAVAIGGYVTARSYQFSADIVSLSGDGRAFRRCRIVVDAQTSPPRVIYRQDLTHLGWPLAPEILSQMKAGVSLDKLRTGQTVGMEAPR